MRLVNYKRGYSDVFECSIHGTIYMSRNEFNKAFRYIKRIKKYLGGDFYFNLFVQDTHRVVETKDYQLINVRITATQKIVQKFSLSGYKPGNYQLAIWK
jgi:hypothetical protein